MADWKKLALDAILADGTIDENEVKILKKELYADGKIDKQEFAFLVELREAAHKKAKGADLHPKFEALFFDVVQQRILSEAGVLSKDAVTVLRQVIFADKKVDESEKKFLTKLKKAVTKQNAEFDKLCAECLGQPAPKPAAAAK